jgi:hypothetical protein
MLQSRGYMVCRKPTYFIARNLGYKVCPKQAYFTATNCGYTVCIKQAYLIARNPGYEACLKQAYFSATNRVMDICIIDYILISTSFNKIPSQLESSLSVRPITNYTLRLLERASHN